MGDGGVVDARGIKRDERTIRGSAIPVATGGRAACGDVIPSAMGGRAACGGVGAIFPSPPKIPCQADADSIIPQNRVAEADNENTHRPPRVIHGRHASIPDLCLDAALVPDLPPLAALQQFFFSTRHTSPPRWIRASNGICPGKECVAQL